MQQTHPTLDFVPPLLLLFSGNSRQMVSTGIKMTAATLHVPGYCTPLITNGWYWAFGSASRFWNGL